MASSLVFPEDHLRHAGAEIEWWYQFAFLNDRYTLMSCIWRYGGKRAEGLMASYALTETAGPRRWTGTWINRDMVKLAQEIMGRTTKPGLFTKGVMQLTREGQSFDPYPLAGNARIASSRSRPLDAGAGPCLFRHDLDAQTLQVDIDDRGIELSLHFDLRSPRFPMNMHGDFAIDGQKMTGYTSPQAPLRGQLRIGGERLAVSGKGWLDHQWGDWTFEQNDGEYRHPEWDYIAVMLGGGASLVVYCGRGSTQELASGCFCDAQGNVERITRFTLRPLHRFRSLRTHNIYDYGWTLELPEFDARLELQPFHPNHEVMTFSRERALMEYGVRVQGTFRGQSCDCFGFVETFGETLAMEETFWKSRALTLDQIAKFLPRASSQAWLANLTASPAPVATELAAIDHSLLDPIWSMLDRGGKTWRGSWFAQCCYALGYEGDGELLRELLPVIELIHTGTLIIDDIQDGSPMRRGRPAVHRELGVDLAINAGNFLYFLPLLVVDGLPISEAQRLETYQRIAVGQRQGHVGQALDLMWSKGRFDLRKKVDEFETTRAQLLEQYRLKCGCQLEAATRIAGSLAQAPAESIEALSVYSNAFGVVYQILDDLKDAGPDDPELGKPGGEDAKNGRLTLLLLYALHSAGPREREEAMLHFARGGDEADAFLRRFFQATGAPMLCLSLAERILEDATQMLHRLPASDARIILEMMPQVLLEDRRKLIQRHVS